MRVTSDQVANLRAFLKGEVTQEDIAHDSTADDVEVVAHIRLVEGAFLTATYRRFAKDTTSTAIERYVRDVRRRSEVGEMIDQRAAERIIAQVVGDEEISDIDEMYAFFVRMQLMVMMITDEQLDDAGLDAVLAEARDFGNRLLERS